MNDGSAPWIKVITRIFEDAKIIALEQLPEGYGVLVIWFKLLTLAGEQNRGGAIYFTDTVPFTTELLAAKWRCKPALVQMALTAFQKLGMIGLDEEGTIWILNWAKYQNEAGLAQIRERSLKQIQDRSPESVEERRAQKRERDAKRQRDWRQSHKGDGSDRAVTRHTSVTPLRAVTGVTERVTVTPPTDDSHRKTVTHQRIRLKKETKEEPSSVSQRETETNGDRELSIEDLKNWMNTLFGRQRAWSYEETQLLAGLIPISKEDRALLSWAYKLPRDNDGWALIRGKRASKPKQNLIGLLREFSSEIDKWRTVRRGGSDDDLVRTLHPPEWTDERRQASRELFPDVPITCQFYSLAESTQREIDKQVRLQADHISAEWVAALKKIYGEDVPIPQRKSLLAPSVVVEVEAELKKGSGDERGSTNAAQPNEVGK